MVGEADGTTFCEVGARGEADLGFGEIVEAFLLVGSLALVEGLDIAEGDIIFTFGMKFLLHVGGKGSCCFKQKKSSKFY